MGKYTVRQIREAVRYWTRKLEALNEGFDPKKVKRMWTDVFKVVPDAGFDHESEKDSELPPEKRHILVRRSEKRDLLKMKASLQAVTNWYEVVDDDDYDSEAEGNAAAAPAHRRILLRKSEVE